MAGDFFANSTPPTWEAVTLGEVVRRGGGQIQTGPFGSQLHASDYVQIGIPFIMPVNIGDNRIIEEGIARITEEDAKRLNRHRIKAGDIIYSRRGDVERRALMRAEQEGWICGSGCLMVRVGKGVADPVFTSYYLAHPMVREWIVRHAVGATMPNLNTSIMEALPFHLPPPPEQQAIAHILGTLDDKIELNRRLNATLEEMARALFKSWFVDFDPVRAKMEGLETGLPAEIAGLFPDGLEESKLGMVPKGWKTGIIDDMAKVSSGKRPGRRYSVDSPQASVPLWGGNGPMAFVSESLIDCPILLTGRVGTLGSVFRITSPCWPSDNTLILKTRSVEAFEFLFFQLKRIDFSSLNRGSTQPLLTQTDLKTQAILLPPAAILLHFSTIVMGLYDRIDASSLESRTLAALRDALLPKLISGEVRVEDAERFISEALS